MSSTANAAPLMQQHAIWPAHWLRALILMLCGLALTSCAPGMQATRATIPAPLLALLKPLPPVDVSLTAQCPAIPPAADDRLSSLLHNHAEAMRMHHQCATIHAGLVRATRERERIEAERIARAAQSLRASGE